jgi:hypothetical protein
MSYTKISIYIYTLILNIVFCTNVRPFIIIYFIHKLKLKSLCKQSVVHLCLCDHCVYRLLQDVSNSTMSVCDSSVVKKKMVVTWGQSIHLGCFLKMPEVLSRQTVTWFHYNKEKGRYQIVYRS